MYYLALLSACLEGNVCVVLLLPAEQSTPPHYVQRVQILFEAE
jgi:hypothetical protein